MTTQDDQQLKSLPSTLYTEEYFLTACEGYDVFLESEGKHLSRRLDEAFAVAEVTPGMKLLDVGCGRGEIVRHCMRMGVEAHGMDYAEVAARMTLQAILDEKTSLMRAGKPHLRSSVCRADAKKLPFPDAYFDRVLMFDVVEHLYPWELHAAMLEVRRVLKPEGRFIIHTAPNRWYDQYAYPVVRAVRTLMGQGHNYPKDPRAITPVNQDVHVNEQDIRSMRQALTAAGFRARVWLDSPPQNRQENFLMAGLRRLAFDVPPFRWFFEREVFAVGTPDPSYQNTPKIGSFSGNEPI
ncbi:MAG: methyltransferase domain-containing protein [Anaerolineales bacterium]|nr:methyltransferase domain-containing protein [Anaerolineales bacterium]MCB8950991.1 methyltransferase domain-containing protein [Ardenticatenales bacterium]